jgi:cyclic lactone autoinducer peptide
MPKELRKEVVSFMKKFFLKYCNALAALALVLTTIAVNTTCGYTMHQEVIPEQAKKLRKF